MTDRSLKQEWYLARDGKRYGPISHDELMEYATSGYVKPEDLLWRKGLSTWVKATTIPNLFTRSTSDAVLDGEAKRAHSPYQTSQNTTRNFVAERLVDNHDMPQSHQDTAAVEINLTESKTSNARKQSKTKVYPQQKYRRSRGQLITKLSVAAAFLLFLIGVGVYLIQLFVPADFISQELAAQVEKQTGRKLIVNGKASFSVIPRFGVKFKNVTLSNPPGVQGPPLLQIAELDINLKFLPLLQQRLEVERVLLRDPKLSLHIDKDAKDNWSFQFAKADSQKQYLSPDTNVKYATNIAQTDMPYQASLMNAYAGLAEALSYAFFFSKPSYAQSTAPSSASFSLKDISFDKIKITNGSVFYKDDRNTVLQSLRDMNFTFTISKVTPLLYAKGRAKWNGEEINFDGNITTPENIVRNGASPISIDLQSQHFTISLSGKLSLLDGLFFTGDGDFQTASLRDMANWLGHEVKFKGGMNNFSLRGKVEAQAQRINFKDANIVFDDIRVLGQGSLLFSGARPYLQASFKTEKLNLEQYLSTSSTTRRYANTTLQDPTTPTSLNAYNREVSLSDTPGFNLVTDSITDSQASDATISAKPINTIASDLDVLDADIAMRFDNLQFKGIKADSGNVTLEIRNGILTANLEKLNLYNGAGSGVFTLNGQEGIPAFTSNFNLNNVAATPFLKDAFQIDYIGGKMNVAYNVKGFGISEKQIISTLNGTGKVNLQDGVINGIDVPKFIRSIKKGRLEGWSMQPSLKTKFSKLSASFKIDKGIFQNDDFELIVPLSEEKKKKELLSTKGSGTVDLVKYWIDYRIQPQITQQTNNKGKLKKKTNVEIPVHIEGPLEKPKIVPDLGAIAQSSDALTKGLKAAEKIFKNTKKKNELTKDDFELLIQGVLGETQKRGDSAQSDYKLKEQSFQLRQFMQQ